MFWFVVALWAVTMVIAYRNVHRKDRFVSTCVFLAVILLPFVIVGTLETM